MRKFAFFMFIFLFTPPAYSEDTVTLDSIIKLAKANNPEIKAMMQKYLAAQQRVTIEKTWEYPQVGIGIDWMDKIEPMFSFSQMLPFPGKLSLKGKIAESEAKVSEQELNLKTIEVVTEVKKAFWMYWLTYKLTDIYKENTELMRRFVGIATEQYVSAKTSQVDVLKANAELAQMEIVLTTFEKENKPKLEAELNVLLNRTATTPLGTPEQPEWKKFNYTSDELETLALKNQPEIKAKEFLSQKDTFSVNLANRELYPDIMAGISYDKMEGSELMFQVQLPLYYNKQSSMVKMLKREREITKLELEATTTTTLQGVKSLWSTIDSYNRKIQIHETRLLPLAKQTIEVTKAEYRTGKTNFLDLLDSQKRYLDYNIEYYKTLAERELVLIELEKEVGTELK